MTSKYATTLAEIPASKDFPWRLIFKRIAKNEFRICYGAEVKTFDSLDLAAAHFAACVIHANQSAGKLDGVRELELL